MSSAIYIKTHTKQAKSHILVSCLEKFVSDFEGCPACENGKMIVKKTNMDLIVACTTCDKEYSLCPTDRVIMQGRKKTIPPTQYIPAFVGMLNGSTYYSYREQQLSFGGQPISKTTCRSTILERNFQGRGT